MIFKRLFQTAFLTLCVLALASQAVWSQTADWHELRPAGEEFSIIMPKDPMIETGKMPYHKMEINTRLYLSNSPTGTTFAVVSLSGFKKFFVSKVTTKATVSKFVVKGPKVLHGNNGREYQVTIGDRSGSAYTFATRRRFYAVVFLTNKKADALRDQFLSSFTLPEFVPRPAPTVAAQPEKTETEVVGEAKEKKENEKEQQATNAGAEATVVGGHDQDAKKPNDGNVEAKPVDGATDTTNGPGQRKPLSGGVLNGKALTLPLPVYPAEARAAQAAGSVTVKVVVDEYGTVISASAVSGHELLRQAAVNAALQARFSPTTLMGEPVKVSGVIVYNFVPR
jgi:TonB family protein